MNTINILREQVKAGNLAIFCGSGVSVPPPSNLPTWRSFISEILRFLTEANSLLKDTPFSIDINRIPLTYFSQILYEVLGDYYFHSLKCFSHAEPNLNHFYIGRLAEKRIVNTIITTNFDTLIEDIMRENGISFKLRVSPDDFEQYILSENPNEVNVLKLHGTVTDTSTLIDIFDRKASGLPIHAGKALARVVKEKFIFFVGYSGADLDFDINYLLLQNLYRDAKGFVWNRRPGEQNVKVEELCELYQDKGFVSEMELADVFSALLETPKTSNQLCQQQTSLSEHTSVDWKTALKEWANSIDIMLSAHFFFRLFCYMGDTSLAWKCSDLILSNLEGSDNSTEWAKCKLDRAKLAWSCNDHRKYHDEIMDIILKEDGPVPIILREELSSDFSIKFSHTIDLMRTSKTLADLFESISPSLGDSERLLILELIQSISTVFGYGQAKMMAEMRKYTEVQHFLAQSIRNEFVKAKFLTEIGKLYFDQFAFKEALQTFQVAATLFDEMNKRSYLANVYIEMGMTYYYLADLKNANLYLDKGIEIAETKQDLINLAFGCRNYAFFNRDKPNSLACERIEKSANIYRMLGLSGDYSSAMRIKAVMEGSIPERFANMLTFDLGDQSVSEKGDE